MKLVLDEHLPLACVRALRGRGHDVVTARDLVIGRDRSDAELLRRATMEHRAVVTSDLVDFIELHRTAVLTGRRHAGVILVSPRRFPPTTRAAGRLISALDAFLTAHRADHDLQGHMVWLN